MGTRNAHNETVDTETTGSDTANTETAGSDTANTETTGSDTANTETAGALFRLLQGHVSVRKYTPDPVADETVRRIIDAGRRAATSSNLQMGTAVVVRDGDTRNELARLCGDQDHIRQAPVFVAWCADRSRLDRACELLGHQQNTDFLESFLVAAVDVSIMMQNAVVAAEALGLGTCYIGGLRNDTGAVVELLQLPRHVFPVAGMTLGWPRRSPSKPVRTKPRLDLEAILHWERYNQEDRNHLESYDRVMAETGIYRGREMPLPEGASWDDDGRADGRPYGWMEHSARRVMAPARTDLATVAKRQGFGLR
jgi:nitroreductase